MQKLARNLRNAFDKRSHMSKNYHWMKSLKASD